MLWQRSTMLRRYACIRQTDQSDCGAAALATVALHYRRPLGLQQLRELAGTEALAAVEAGEQGSAIRENRLGGDRQCSAGPRKTRRGVPKLEEGENHVAGKHHPGLEGRGVPAQPERGRAGRAAGQPGRAHRSDRRRNGRRGRRSGERCPPVDFDLLGWLTLIAVLLISSAHTVGWSRDAGGCVTKCL